MSSGISVEAGIWLMSEQCPTAGVQALSLVAQGEGEDPRGCHYGRASAAISSGTASFQRLSSKEH